MLKRLTEWILGFLPESESSKKEINVPALLLIGADYDPFTKHAVAWMKDLRSNVKLTCPNIVELHNDDLSKVDVRVSMALTDVQGRVEIFCGHGDYDALLGPPAGSNSDIEIDGLVHSVIYDTSMVPRTSGSLLAFSCRSAALLGRAYTTYTGKGFIGFDDDLPLDFSPEFITQLRHVFTSIAIDILSVGRVIPEHKGALQRLYDEAIRFFLDGEGRTAPKTFFFQLLLVEHRQCINLHTSHSL